MKKFDGISDTLFVPLIGRIYATKHHFSLLYDKYAVDLESKIESQMLNQNCMNEYTLLASATRNHNFDQIINDFIMNSKGKSTIINLGAGLDTTCYRIKKGDIEWFDVDLPNVIEYRKSLMGESDTIHFVSGSIFEPEWINQIQEYKPETVLVIALGLFHYFSENEVLKVINEMFKKFVNIDIVFDTVSKSGLIRSNNLVSQMGNKNAKMFFYVNNEKTFANKLLSKPIYIHHKGFYTDTLKLIGKDIKNKTRLFMKISDLFNMVKIVHLSNRDHTGLV
ncbi:MAG: class I SAM-dependent methyltransferase [Candidatus Izemoplasmatales bacterium]|nr:class I SAM-dependent methyltransferase [Candidatus Izemoplasmatales bacterium]